VWRCGSPEQNGPEVSARRRRVKLHLLPTGVDVGHQLACEITVTYPLPLLVTAAVSSPAITVQSPPAPPAAPLPSLSALRVSPATFTLMAAGSAASAGRAPTAGQLAGKAKHHLPNHSLSIRRRPEETQTEATTPGWLLRSKSGTADHSARRSLRSPKQTPHRVAA
jgi:hypothetical protein